MLHAAVTFCFPCSFVWMCLRHRRHCTKFYLFYSNFLKPPYSLWSFSVFIFISSFLSYIVIIWGVPSSVKHFLCCLLCFSDVFPSCLPAPVNLCTPPSTSLGRPASLGPVFYKVVSFCCALFLYAQHMKGIRCASRSGSLQFGSCVPGNPICCACLPFLYFKVFAIILWLETLFFST